MAFRRQFCSEPSLLVQIRDAVKGKRTAIRYLYRYELNLLVHPSGKMQWLYYTKDRIQQRVLGVYPSMTLEEALVAADWHEAGRISLAARAGKELKLKPLWEEYFEKVKRLLSKEMVAASRMSMDAFLQYLETVKIELFEEAATSLTITGFKVWLQGNNKANGTINKYISHVRRVLTRIEKDNQHLKADLGRMVRMTQQSRDLVLTEEELDIIFGAAKGISLQTYLFVTILYTTLARRKDVAGMLWEDIVDNVWKYKCRKTGSFIKVPLTGSTVELLEQQRVDNKHKYNVFRPFSIQYTLKKLRSAALEAKVTRNLQEFRLHDLRRTAATALATAGCSRSAIKAALGHSSFQYIDVYVKTKEIPDFSILDTRRR